MFVKLKDILQENDYTVTDEEVKKAFQTAGYIPITNTHNIDSEQRTEENS